MKLHFEPNLDCQLQAIEAVCDLFRGQETCRTEFTVTRDAADAQTRMTFAENDLGIGNRLTLLDDELLANLHAIQLRHGLAPSVSLTSGDFTVEMETGTGKTYVYLRTVFELNKRFGFTKFVIVVPSVAIKEGVYKTLQITEEHFKGLYAGATSSICGPSPRPGRMTNLCSNRLHKSRGRTIACCWIDSRTGPRAYGTRRRPWRTAGRETCWPSRSTRRCNRGQGKP